MYKKSLLISIFLELLALCLYVSFVDAWLAQGNYHNDVHPGKCMITETLVISPGETVKMPNSCANITCLNEEGHARIKGCGAIAPPAGCKWGEHVDINAPLRECCARHLICKDGITEEMRAFEQHVWQTFKERTGL